MSDQGPVKGTMITEGEEESAQTERVLSAVTDHWVSDPCQTTSGVKGAIPIG